MRRLWYLAAPASWVFFTVMWHLSTTRWDAGFAIYVGGSVIFFCIGFSLLIAGLVKREGIFALCGIVTFVPLLIGLQLSHDIDEIGACPVPLSLLIVDAQTQKPIPNALVRI